MAESFQDGDGASSSFRVGEGGEGKAVKMEVAAEREKGCAATPGDLNGEAKAAKKEVRERCGSGGVKGRGALAAVDFHSGDCGAQLLVGQGGAFSPPREGVGGTRSYRSRLV